jgi:hypothetical protein
MQSQPSVGTINWHRGQIVDDDPHSRDAYATDVVGINGR